MSTISIAMATYNGAEYLDQQLESIASQTLQPDELIVSDDCSTDRTLKMIERFARNAPFPVRIFRNQENAGFNCNFARAIAKTSGDVVFLADQDDIWFADKIDHIAAEFDRSAQLLAVIHDERIIDQATGEFLDCTYFANERALGLDDRELVSGNCTALRRELIEILLPFPEGINYDYWIGWIAEVLKCRVILEEPLQIYRRHAGNATNMLLAAERPSSLSQLLRSGFQDLRPAWQETADQYRLITQRIEQRSPLIDRCLGGGRAASSAEGLWHEIDSLERRIEVMSLPPLRRQIEVLRNWGGGFYRHFSGARSAMRDLLQP